MALISALAPNYFKYKMFKDKTLPGAFRGFPAFLKARGKCQVER
jgi:hypothetical protein